VQSSVSIGLTSHQFAHYLYDTGTKTLPASWAEVAQSNGHAKLNGHATNGVNGHVNGHTNGHANGATVTLPASFLDGKAVRTVYGLVPLRQALDWPIFASYDELAGCALWMGGRIPTAEEARSLYSHVDRLKKEEAERKLGKTVPAVNGFVIISPSAAQPCTEIADRSYYLQSPLERRSRGDAPITRNKAGWQGAIDHSLQGLGR
jgi:L-histidine Nalpha-methyltransferase / hercynylcysteine S-oxide synthase